MKESLLYIAIAWLTWWIIIQGSWLIFDKPKELTYNRTHQEIVLEKEKDVFDIVDEPIERLEYMWEYYITNYFTPAEWDHDPCWWGKYTINYSWDCRVTASWHRLQKEEADYIVACAPNIPLGSRLRVEWIPNDVWCRDRWWAIKWNRLDWWRWYWKEAEAKAKRNFTWKVYIVTVE